ncbi:MAG TPA: DoxX family protein [Vicinamibacterales bacterium]|nr:DoxX family protein [Vicinamibacterales bacterium]
MTTLFSAAATVDRTQDIARVSNGRVVLWVGQFVIAAAFLMAGGSKFAGAPAMVQMFDAIGIGQWFRYVTATIEVGSAIALLVPSLAPYGAAALVATMTGAVATHLFIVGGSPLPALVLGAGSAAIAWFRRDQF